MSGKPKSRITISDLKAALEDDDWLTRSNAFGAYARQKPEVEAIPLLRKAIADRYHGTVKCAAQSLGKLGPAAKDSMNDLLAAATVTDKATKCPQCYPHCVEAMVVIQPSHPYLIPLIKNVSMSYGNWVPIHSSLRALKVIGTPEAVELIDEIVVFWEQKINKMQLRVAKEFVADAKCRSGIE